MSTKDQLLDAALLLFSREGYGAVSIKRIIQAVGVTKPTLYHHFGNKAGLLEDLLDLHGSVLAAAVRKAAEYEHDLVRHVEAVFAAYFRFASEHRPFFRLFMGMMYAPPDSEEYIAARRLMEEQLGILEDLFVSAVPDHGNLRGKSRLLALTLVGAATAGIMEYWETGREPDSGSVHLTAKQFMHGIFS